jgi:hypothetical protein
MITYYTTLEVYEGPIDQYIRFCKPKFIAKSDAHSMITWMECLRTFAGQQPCDIDSKTIFFCIYDLRSELKY